MTLDKFSDRRRGFVFVSFVSEESVDKCTETSFHVVAGYKVRERDLLT